MLQAIIHEKVKIISCLIEMSLLIPKADANDLTQVIFTSSFLGKASVLAGKNSYTTNYVGFLVLNSLSQHFIEILLHFCKILCHKQNHSGCMYLSLDPPLKLWTYKPVISVWLKREPTKKSSRGLRVCRLNFSSNINLLLPPPPLKSFEKLQLLDDLRENRS